MVRDYCFETRGIGPVCSKPFKHLFWDKNRLFLLFCSWSDYGLGRRGIGAGWTWSTDPVCQVTNWSTTCSITWYYVSAAHIQYTFLPFSYSPSAPKSQKNFLELLGITPPILHAVWATVSTFCDNKMPSLLAIRYSSIHIDIDIFIFIFIYLVVWYWLAQTRQNFAQSKQSFNEISFQTTLRPSCFHKAHPSTVSKVL